MDRRKRGDAGDGRSGIRVRNLVEESGLLESWSLSLCWSDLVRQHGSGGASELSGEWSEKAFVFFSSAAGFAARTMAQQGRRTETTRG